VVFQPNVEVIGLTSKSQELFIEQFRRTNRNQFTWYV